MLRGDAGSSGSSLSDSILKLNQKEAIRFLSFKHQREGNEFYDAYYEEAKLSVVEEERFLKKCKESCSFAEYNNANFSVTSPHVVVYPAKETQHQKYYRKIAPGN